jgi:hypothetical protein
MEHTARTGDMRNVYKSLVGQSEEKGPHDTLGRLRDDNTKRILTMKRCGF